MMWASNSNNGTPTTKSIAEDCCIDVIECAR